MKMRIRAILAAVIAAFGFVTMMPTAQASVDWRINNCSVGYGTLLQVTSWKNNSRTQKTYHWRIEAKGYGVGGGGGASFSVRDIYWNNVALTTGPSNIYLEGYRYSSYTGSTPWKGQWQRYDLGVPTTKPTCGFYV